MFNPQTQGIPLESKQPVQQAFDEVAVRCREFSATEFRALVIAHEQVAQEARKRLAIEAMLRRQEEIRSLLRAALSDEEWLLMLSSARRAAAAGASQCVIFRFPALLCDDGGRAVNLPDPEWPKTLRGKAAKVFLRWRDELRPQGFCLTARIASFPEGVPGDVELSLVWGH